jgi:hypothetical protein
MRNLPFPDSGDTENAGTLVPDTGGVAAPSSTTRLHYRAIAIDRNRIL